MKEFILDLWAERSNKIKIVMKNDKINFITKEFDPYFYLITDNPEKIKKGLEKSDQFKEIEVVNKTVDNKEQKILKITTHEPSEVQELASELKHLGEVREHDISYPFRFLIDNDLYCSVFYDKDFSNPTQDKLELNMKGFDIEVYSKKGMPDPRKNPIILMSYAGKEDCKSFSADKSEKKMLEEFIKEIQTDDPDVLIGYNSSAFDLPYIKKRCAENKINFDIGRGNKEVTVKRTAMGARVGIPGRIHLDAYKGISFLMRTDMINLPRYTLKSVYKALLGKEKLDMDHKKMHEYWDDKGEKKQYLIEYNKQDSIAAREIGKYLLPLYIEFSKIVGLPVYDISNMTATQMDEWLLIREAYQRNMIVPNRPNEKTVEMRIRNPIQGAFVKLPKEGVHEKIVVCDYKSLYPSMIIAHNLSPDTLNCECCAKTEKTPAGHVFCKKKQGIIPAVLNKLLDERVKTKKEMKKYSKEEFDYKILNARQQALKLLANSMYGYTVYGRSRWYCREAGESATAFGRKYIQETQKKAEEAGFEVLYEDTDSAFLLLGNKTIDDVKKFVEKVNKELPGRMELELEGYYPRGIFVTKKQGGAAKKRYALMREDGSIQIKGFEFVRRDWSKIAKETQRKVIETVLKEGKPEKAIEIVKAAIKKIKDGKATNEELTIYTKLTRSLDEYQQIGPHVKAAQKLQQKGEKVKAGDVIGYIVTKEKGSISDRSYPIELIDKREADPEYYIDHQVLPAVMKILQELGIKEEDLKYLSKQDSLQKWF